MPEYSFGDLNPPARVLLGPGPSNIHPRVQQAIMAPLVGFLDPYFFQVMDETTELLRSVFQANNAMTLPMSGTGSAGMETILYNALEPGDTAVIGVNGFFSQRMVEMASRCGAKVVQVPADWGRIIEPEAIESALKAQRRVKVLALVHAETSTGVLQPLVEASKLAKEHDALFLVDAVTSLGGCDLNVKNLGIDLCYSGTQKCLSCPPGLAPLTASEKAMSVVRQRGSKVQSWYLDLSLIEGYWSSGRAYHHTGPISMIYAIREALRLVVEEGLEQRFQRHERHGAALRVGLEAMGLELHAQSGHRTCMLTSVRIPEGVDDLRVRRALLDEFGIEIGGALGLLKGKVWRIGLMGESSKAQNVLLVLWALEKVLGREGWELPPGAGVAAAAPALTA